MIWSETEMSSFWWNWNLSKWKLSVRPVLKVSAKWRNFRFSVPNNCPWIYCIIWYILLCTCCVYVCGRAVSIYGCACDSSKWPLNKMNMHLSFCVVIVFANSFSLTHFTAFGHYVTNESINILSMEYRADSRFAPSQWETPLLCLWLSACLESALEYHSGHNPLITYKKY